VSPAVRNPVVTRKLKFDGSAKPAWRGDLVGADDEWLVVYYDSPPHTTGAGESVAHALRYFSLALPLSVLVCFDTAGRVLEYQCDAGLPARINGRSIDFVDLDVMALADGSHFVRDHDTLARNAAAMAYSEEAVTAAHEGIRLAEELLEHGAFPFDGHPALTLGRVLAAQGPL
jgi:hypothetical protein